MATTDVMTRINRIFESVLGCSCEFQSASDLNADLAPQWAREDLAMLQEGRSNLPLYFESLQLNSFGFPIRVDGRFVGLAVVRGLSQTPPQRLLMLAELLTMVLEFGIKKEEQDAQLRMAEQRLYMFDENSNVIPLHRARRKSNSSLEQHEAEFDLESLLSFDEEIVEPAMDVMNKIELKDESAVTMGSAPLLLQTTPAFPLHRLAIELHEMSKRWALLNMEDLPSETWSSRESISELGGITVFIRDLTCLTTNQQLKLAEYLSHKPTEDQPRIIAGITGDIVELEASGQLLPHLTSLMTLSKLGGALSQQTSTRDIIDASLEVICTQVRETHAVGDHYIPFNAQYFPTSDDTTSVH